MLCRAGPGAVLPDWQLHYPGDRVGWVAWQLNGQVAGNAAGAVLLRHIWRHRKRDQTVQKGKHVPVTIEFKLIMQSDRKHTFQQQI
jgi:hypothetical protein